MTLLRYEPWGVVARLQRHFDQSFGDGAATNGENLAAWVPSVDIHQQADKFVMRADLPGVEPKTSMSRRERRARSRASANSSAPRNRKKGSSGLERVEGRFLRRFTLPDNVQSDNIPRVTATACSS